MIYRNRRTIYIPQTQDGEPASPTTYQAETFPSINAAKRRSRELGGNRGLVRVGRPSRAKVEAVQS